MFLGSARFSFSKTIIQLVTECDCYAVIGPPNGADYCKNAHLRRTLNVNRGFLLNYLKF